MSSITKYRVEKDGLNHPFLVEEKSIEYGLEKLDRPWEIVDLVNKAFRLRYLAEEEVCLVCLDTKGTVLGLFSVSHGTINGSICKPREIFVRALIAGASSIVILHNHPSGDPTPSDQDVLACERLSNSSKVIGIKMCDFIIVGDGIYYSFCEQGLSCLG